MRQIRRVGLGLFILATAVSLAPRSAVAQSETCVYARCALSLRQHPARIVQGVGATPVVSLGLLAPRIDLLTTSSENARLHYQAFRGDYNRGAVLELIGFAAGVSSVFVLAGNPRANYPAALGIFALGVPVGITSLVFKAKAQSQLEQSLAAYNRTLPDTP
ncbi:MAG TPA: hypothetical protein VGV12_06765 [Gemmatimonadales bacterium]|nr:hypothetical protein [Gemmatimonadales bacterium]